MSLKSQAGSSGGGGGAAVADEYGGVLLATGSYDHTIKFWQANTGNCVRTLQHGDSQVNAMKISPDRKFLAAAGYQHVRMYDLVSGHPNPVVCYDGLSKNVTSVGFFDTGKCMYTGGEDNMARIWDLRARSGQCNRIFQVNSPITSVCLHPNQTELIVADEGGCINIWDLRTDKTEQLIPEPNGVTISCVDIDPDTSYLAAVNTQGTCFVWSVSQYQNPDCMMTVNPRAKLKAHSKYALKCKFSPDSTLLATTSADHSVKIWQTSHFELTSTLTVPLSSDAASEIPHGWVWDCEFSSDSQYLITASSDCLARIWNVNESKIEREFIGHSKAVVCLAFNETN